MKKFAIGLCLIAVVGCSTPQQTTAFNTINTVEQTATLAVDGYFTLVIKGTVSTNSLPDVARAYDALQAAGQLAASAAQAGTNALAPASLVLEATQLGTLIQTIETKK